MRLLHSDAYKVMLRQSIGIILSEAVSAYLEPSIRQTSYQAVKPKNLSKMLEKLSQVRPSSMTGSVITAGDVDRMRRRRLQAEAVAKIA
jgi:exocyst complex component 6